MKAEIKKNKEAMKTGLELEETKKELIKGLGADNEEIIVNDSYSKQAKGEVDKRITEINNERTRQDKLNLEKRAEVERLREKIKLKRGVGKSKAS